MNPTDQPLVALAERIATKAHEGQFRRDGVTPYITHCARVVARLRAQGVTDEVTLAVGWLHDVLEDGNDEVKIQYVMDMPWVVRRSVEDLTRVSGMSYESYMAGLAINPRTRTVKIADILDNLSDAPTEKQIIKYSKALLYLHNETP